MKTAITARSGNLSAQLDPRFGRCAYFCVLDEDTRDVEFIENKQAEANSGAGTKAAEKMVELGVQKVVSGDFGPKAKSLLDKFNIQLVVMNDDHKSLSEIIETLIQK
mgnify:CR=1 FL=1